MTSKIELGIFLLFCALCAVAESTTRALVVPSETAVPSIAEEGVVATEPLPDITESEPALTPEPVTSPTTTPEPTPRPEVAPTPTEQTEPQIISYMDYIDHYAGLCPSEQPKESAGWTRGRFLAALGTWSWGPSPKHYIETYWEDWHYTTRTDVQYVSSFSNVGTYPYTYTNSHAAIYIDWSTWTVFWETSVESPTYSASWDATVAEMQGYLNELESRYRQLCPNG